MFSYSDYRVSVLIIIICIWRFAVILIWQAYNRSNLINYKLYFIIMIIDITWSVSILDIKLIISVFVERNYSRICIFLTFNCLDFISFAKLFILSFSIKLSVNNKNYIFSPEVCFGNCNLCSSVCFIVFVILYIVVLNLVRSGNRKIIAFYFIKEVLWIIL